MNDIWIRVSAALIAIMVTVGLITMIEMGKDDEGDLIPAPPPGHEYCVTADGEGLKLCEKAPNEGRK